MIKLFKKKIFLHFSPNWPTGSIRFSSRNFRPRVVCPLPMQFFSVNRVCIFAWTESAFWCGSLVSSRALKTGMCSDWPPSPPQRKKNKNATSHFLTPAETKSATIRMGRELRCLLYAGFVYCILANVKSNQNHYHVFSFRSIREFPKGAQVIWILYLNSALHWEVRVEHSKG